MIHTVLKKQKSEMFQTYLLLLLMIYMWSIPALGSRISYASTYGWGNMEVAAYFLWSSPVTPNTPEADCGMLCFTDTKCVSYSIDVNDGICKGYSQTIFEEVSTGTNPDMSFFYSDRCGNPSAIFRADIINGTVKDRYNSGEMLGLKCQSNDNNFDSECGERGQWTNADVCTESQVPTVPWIHTPQVQPPQVHPVHVPASTPRVQPVHAQATTQLTTESLAAREVTTETTSSIPSGFSSALNDTIKYKLVSYPVDFNSAKSTCSSYGGRMIKVMNNDTMGFIQDIAENVGVCLWIDGNKDTGAWLFSNDNPIETFFWAPGEPNDKNGGEYCINIVEHGGTYGWNDVSCGYPYCYAICTL